MESPKISWHVSEQMEDGIYDYIQCKTYNQEGSVSPGNILTKTIQVWNNYGGNQSIADAKNCKLVISFKNFEDNMLLHLIKVRVDNGEEQAVDIDIDKGIVKLGDISGIANNGSQYNSSNYITINIIIGPIPNNIRNELKSMYFYLEYDPV